MKLETIGMSLNQYNCTFSECFSFILHFILHFDVSLGRSLTYY